MEERVRDITTNYHSLQGLRMLPWFLWILALGAVNPITGLPQGRLDYQCLLVVPGIAVPWVLSKLIGDYYDRTFGRVEGLQRRSRQVEWLIAIASLIIAYIGFLVDSLDQLPVSVTGLIMAALFARSWVSSRFLTHYAVLAVLLAIASLLPLTGIPAGGHWFRLLNGFILPIGLAIVLSIGSILNHIVLVRNLKSLADYGNI